MDVLFRCVDVAGGGAMLPEGMRRTFRRSKITEIFRQLHISDQKFYNFHIIININFLQHPNVQKQRTRLIAAGPFMSGGRAAILMPDLNSMIYRCQVLGCI